MPTSSPLTPKSVLRHRPLPSPEGARKARPTMTRASRPALTTQEVVPPFVCSPAHKTHVQKRRSHLNMTSLGIGMVVAILAVLLGQLLLTWLGTTWDDLHYGSPRTYQLDAVVGHEVGATPSHFIALNLNGRIEVIELQGGDPARTKIYLGPQITGPGADMVPVTVQFVDPHHTHRPDMLIKFQGTQVVFHNVNGVFQPGQL